MNKSEKEKYAKLICLEVNSYLHKIYLCMKKKISKHAELHHSDITMRTASFGATKAWEFRPNNKKDVAKGKVGKLTIITKGLNNNIIRKQRALLIAAELYTYHAFASQTNPALFESIIEQNQYKDMIKKVMGTTNAHELRDKAIRYVIEEINEHNLAHFRGHGWVVSISKLDKHYPKIAKALGSSEKTFKDVFRKQHQIFNPTMLKQEDNLVKKEVEDIDYLIKLIRKREKKIKSAYTKKIMDIHLANLKTFRKSLNQIINNLESWVVADRKEHKLLAKRTIIPTRELNMLMSAEASAEKIDMNKVHLVFKYFEKEKINILNDLELVDKISASLSK